LVSLNAKIELSTLLSYDQRIFFKKIKMQTIISLVELWITQEKAFFQSN
jgi:hypothetical protein